MNAPEPAKGWLVLTTISAADGEAESEMYKIESWDDCSSPDGPIQRFAVDLGDTRTYMITLHELGQILPEVRPYRELIQALIAADEPCQGFGCGGTMLGHLLAACTPDQIEMVRALDPSQLEEP